eukprot:bmy_06440T0
MRIRVAGSAAAPSPPVNGEPGEPAVYLDRKVRRRSLGRYGSNLKGTGGARAPFAFSPLGADRRQPHLTLTSASRATDWVWDRPHPMKAGDGEAGPGDPPRLSGAPGGDEAKAPALVQLIDEHGTYSTARLVPDGSAEERSCKQEPGSLRSGSEGREGLARPRQFSCAACGRAFKRAWELLSHEVVHTAARPFRCGLCAAAFKRHSDCKSHRLAHSDERPHGCDACGKRFKRATNLQVRRGGRGRREAGPTRKGQGRAADPRWAGRVARGGACGEKAGQGNGPKVGPGMKGGVELSGTRVSRALDWRGERPFPCASCSKRSETPYELHAPSRPFPCRDCGKAFAAEPALLLHRRQHCEDKPHACRVRSKRFTHRHSLRVHERVRTGDRPFVCPLCAKAFKQSDPLASHLRRPYPCATCGKAFKQSSYLAIHRRTHTGERPYPCDGCSKAFSRPSLLLQHRRVHSPVRPHACRFCPKHFKDLNYHTVHEKVHRGDTPYSQEESL